MNWEAIAAITEVFGLIAVVASLIYIGRQAKQTNDHATASSEIGWIDGWDRTLNSWVSDERTITILQKGFLSFKGMSNSEQAVFHMRVGSIVNQWLLAMKLSQKGLMPQEMADEVTKIVIATLTTQGGFEYIEHDWKLFPGGAELMDMLRANKAKNPTLTEILPWWSADDAET